MPNTKQLDQEAKYLQGRCEQFIDDYARDRALPMANLLRRVATLLSESPRQYIEAPPNGQTRRIIRRIGRRIGRPPGSKNKAKAISYNKGLMRTLEKAHAAQQQEAQTGKKEK